MRASLVLSALAAILAACGGKSTVAEVDEDAGDGRATVDVVGTWHDCSTTIVYGPDGTTTAINHREGGCTARGAYEVIGDVVTTTWTEPGCGFGPEPRPHRVIRAEEGLAAIDPASGRVSLRANGALTSHRLYRVVGREGDLPETASILSVVGDPSEEFGSGCYWSEDGMCGGVFSCSGSVLQWRVEDGALNASVACRGGCPCGAILAGAEAADGSIEGTYDGVNCSRRYEGTFRAEPL